MSPKRVQGVELDGALVVNKPAGVTSHDVVEAVRRVVGFRRVGHLGTLDPIATGVLVLLLGRATRLARFYSSRRKRYLCTFRFGFATDTYDAAGEPQGPDTAPQLSREELEPLLTRFIGRFEQMPPPYSAKKIRGRPAHELARKHRPVTLKPVEVEVYEFRLLEVDGPRARFAIECGPGTYIRSLAHELGQLHGSGAHVAEITRTAVGEFTLEQAQTLETIAAAAQAGQLRDLVIPLERLLGELPQVTVLPVVERRIRHGSRFTISPAQVEPGSVPASALDAGQWKPARLRVFNRDRRLIAIAEAVVPRVYRPVVVLEPAETAA